MEQPCKPRSWSTDHWLACAADVSTAAGLLIGAVHNGGATLTDLRSAVIDWHECHWLSLLNQLATEYAAHGLTIVDVREQLLAHEIQRIAQ